MNRRTILALAVLFTSSVAPGSKAQSSDVSEKGRYSNYDYAYSVLVPPGTTAFRDQAPFPNHGFLIDISKSEQSYLWVDASYNAAEWASFDEAVRANLRYLRDEGAANIILEKQSSTYLSRLQAIRFIVRYDLSGKQMVQETVLAFRREKNKEEIVYSISLRSLAARFERDRMAIEELRRTWGLQRQP